MREREINRGTPRVSLTAKKREVGQNQREAQDTHEMEIIKQKDISRSQRVDGIGMGPWQVERMSLRGKKIGGKRERESAEPVTVGPRLEKAGAETGRESGTRSEPTSMSQAAPQDPGGWGLGAGGEAELCTTKGEERLRGTAVGRWGTRGRALLGEGQGDVGAPPGGREPSLPGPRLSPAQPPPRRHSRILVGRRAGLPRGPRKTAGRCSGAGWWCGRGGGRGQSTGPPPPPPTVAPN